MDRAGKWRVRKSWTDKNGYQRICMTMNGRHNSGIGVHRVMLIASGVGIPLGFECDHINRDPSDNRLCNLRVVTRSANQQNRNFVQTGERNNAAKLNDEKVRQIRSMLADGLSHPAVARVFGVSPALIRLVGKREVWAHVA